jgi:RNA polymerase sigma factor (sigma-70 family)
MDEDDKLARRFEASRPRLRAMAYRMLGSLSDADDAVQEGWLRAAGAGSDDVANLEGWFTTIVARVCLDMLRSRKSRREEPLDPDDAMVAGPEQEAMLADSVGLAMLVVLDKLPPAERVAFVLHDTFGLPFGEIAAITGRTPASARQLASRARRRIQGSEQPRPRLARQREVARAFMAAARGGDLGALIAVLDPDVVLRADAAASPSGVPVTVRGAAAVAGGARAATARARYGRVALINGTPGLVMAPRGRLVLALAFTYSGDKISQIDVIADPGRLEALDLALLEG